MNKDLFFKTFKFFKEKSKFIIYFCLIIFGVVLSKYILNSVILYEDEIDFLVPYFIEKKYIGISNRVWEYSRFLPFQFIDYNILLLLHIPYNNTSLASINNLFFSYQVVKLWIVILLEFLILKDICKFNKLKLNNLIFLFCFAICFCNDMMLGVLGCLRYAELTMMLFIFLFIFAYQRYYFTKKAKYFIISLISSVYLLYMKEVLFIPLGVISGINFLFNKKNKCFNLLNIAIIANCILFLCLYFIFAYNSSQHYLIYKEMQFGNLNNFYFFLHKEIFITISLILGFFVLFKMIYYCSEKISIDKKLILYYSFLYASFFHTIAYFILNLGLSYYYIPSLVFFVPVIFYFLMNIKRKSFKLIICLFFIYMFNHYTMFFQSNYNFNVKRIERTKAFNFEVYKSKNVYIFNPSHWNERIFNKIIFCLKLINQNVKWYTDEKLTKDDLIISPDGDWENLYKKFKDRIECVEEFNSTLFFDSIRAFKITKSDI